jgi:hypothetical protein
MQEAPSINPEIYLEPDPATHKKSSSLAQITLYALVLLLWLLLLPYAGVRHDARLYTAQALWHIHSEIYGNDIFFRYGSQDSFTLFTPVYVQLIRLFGVEHAAALITAFSQLAFMTACWFFAKRMYPPLIATVVVGLILILPGNYGSDYIFTYLETFATPRLLAESLTLFSLLAFVHQKKIIGSVLLLCSLLMHPIMAMAGVTFLAARWALNHPKLAALIAVSAATIVIPLTLSPLGTHFRFDHEWLSIVERRSPYLFLRNWAYADWARLAVPLTTLAMNVWLQPNNLQQKWAKIASLTAILGLLVSLIGNDMLGLVLVTQAQPWRWLWLITLCALLLLPSLLHMLWQHEKAGQTTVFLLVAAWLVRNEASSMGIIVFAASSAIAWRLNGGSQQLWRLLWVGSLTLLLLVVTWLIVMNSMTAGILLDTYHVPNWLDLFRDVCTDGLIPLISLALAYFFATSTHFTSRLTTAIAISLALIFLSHFMIANWLYEEYPASLIAKMESWRKLIPYNEEILWLDGITPTWLAVQRASYISGVQTTITLFSRTAAIEAKKRADEVTSVFPQTQTIDWTTKGTSDQSLSHLTKTTDLNKICAGIHVRFIVSNDTLNAKPIASAPIGMPIGYQNAKLYKCQDSSR